MSYDANDWWDTAVQRNHAALLRIVAVLVFMSGLDEGGADVVSRRVVRRILRLLRPAESAARRLIVVAARGITPPPLSPLRGGDVPKGQRGALAQGSKGPPLSPRAATSPPQGGRVAQFPLADPDEEINARPFCRRVQALKDVLDNLPGYAQRLARREARRKLALVPIEGARRTCVRRTLRWGHPPGHRRKPEREVDDLLRECHALALHAMAAPDTG